MGHSDQTTRGAFMLQPSLVKFGRGCSAGVRNLCTHFWGTEQSHQVHPEHRAWNHAGLRLCTQWQRCFEDPLQPSGPKPSGIALHKNPPPTKRSSFLHSPNALGTSLTYPEMPPVSGTLPTPHLSRTSRHPTTSNSPRSPELGAAHLEVKIYSR